MAARTVIPALIVFGTSLNMAQSQDNVITRYKCPGNLRFSAEFADGKSRATIRLWNGEQLTVAREEASSRGTFYRGGNVIFFVLGKEASLTLGDVLHRQCSEVRAQIRPSPR
jgi:membrane-bound inhibitor of C-type lysozyme